MRIQRDRGVRGFTGQDRIQVQVTDSFGGVAVVTIDILVSDCAPPGGVVPPPVLTFVQGEPVSIVVPLTFETVATTAWETVTLTSTVTGTSYSGVLAVAWDARIGRYVLSVDTSGVPPGTYELVIPLGNGETVTLDFEVTESA